VAAQQFQSPLRIVPTSVSRLAVSSAAKVPASVTADETNSASETSARTLPSAVSVESPFRLLRAAHMISKVAHDSASATASSASSGGLLHPRHSGTRSHSISDSSSTRASSGSITPAIEVPARTGEIAADGKDVETRLQLKSEQQLQQQQ
jgi:hypothetical protein